MRGRLKEEARKEGGGGLEERGGTTISERERAAGAGRARGEARRAAGWSSVQSRGWVLLPPRSPWPGGGGEAASPVYVFF